MENYEKFLAYSREVFKEGYEKLVDVPFLNLWSMVKVAPQLVRLGAHRSVFSAVAKHIKDPHLREAFSFHSLLVGGNPFEASSIYTLIHYLEKKWGVSFPRGGTGALIQGLVKLFEELGGKIRYEAAVKEICTNGDKVTGVELESGARERFDIVVSNADVAHTYRDLLSREPKLKARAKRIENKRFSMSLFLIYFGTNRLHPGIAHHSILFGNRYKALLDDIFNKGVLPDDFSLYLHRPTATDPSLAPPGCESFYVLSPVAHLGKNPIDWSQEKRRYADKILAYLEKFYIPGLRESMVTERLFTPDDFSSELNAHHGSAFSLEPTLLQSAYFRVHNRDDKIRGLYFVGAGTHPGAGIPGVVNSGKATTSVILEDYRFLRSPETSQASMKETYGNA
jgi:phytoene desaturase